jgi:hypothetical protein
LFDFSIPNWVFFVDEISQCLAPKKKLHIVQKIYFEFFFETHHILKGKKKKKNSKHHI